jgi:hypothetical protein
VFAVEAVVALANGFELVPAAKGLLPKAALVDGTPKPDDGEMKGFDAVLLLGARY